MPVNRITAVKFSFCLCFVQLQLSVSGQSSESTSQAKFERLKIEWNIFVHISYFQWLPVFLACVFDCLVEG